MLVPTYDNPETDTTAIAIYKKQMPDYRINAEIQTASGVADAALYWSTDSASGYQMITMADAGSDVFSAEIPGQSYNTRVHYYIEATTNSGKTMQKPIVAPDGAYNFLVHPDGVAGVENVSANNAAPGNYQLKQNYPNPFKLETQIQYSLPGSEFVTLKIYNSLG